MLKKRNLSIGVGDEGGFAPDVKDAREVFEILTEAARMAGYEVGKDVFIISYNEFDSCEVILNGLTTVSTDFKQMGQIAAAMILEKKTWKEHCDFKMTRRYTF